VNGVVETHAPALAQAIVDTVREPILVLDEELRVVAASRSFYQVFGVAADAVLGRSIDDLGEGQFGPPGLRPLLEAVIPQKSVMAGFEIGAVFPGIGKRTLLLNARKVFYEENGHKTLLLAFEDITERREIERERAVLLQQSERLLAEKEMLLKELQHRIANSLQIIASILLLKASTVTSDETRQHLQDAHRRVMSVATLQQQIQAAGRSDEVQISSYLAKLCDSLATSMIGEHSAISLKVVSDDTEIDSAHAVSLGLIVTELVINALKYAFPNNLPNGQVVVSYEISGANWRLSVADNGVGSTAIATLTAGLGTSLVKALAQQLKARVETERTPKGTSVSITHVTFAPRSPATSDYGPASAAAT
jgi:chemotaxis protein methyltransferase CheR